MNLVENASQTRGDELLQECVPQARQEDIPGYGAETKGGVPRLLPLGPGTARTLRGSDGGSGRDRVWGGGGGA